MMAHVIIVRKWEKFHCDNFIFAKTKKYQIEKDKLCHTEINSKPGLNEQPNEGYNVFTGSSIYIHPLCKLLKFQSPF